MNKSACDILIGNGQVVTMDPQRRIYRPGAVAITGSRIVEVGPDADLGRRIDAAETIDAGGGIVHPGFIDAHNHIVHTSCRGVGSLRDDTPSHVNFADWKADVTDDDEAAATAMAGVEMLRSGFTMFIEPGSLFSTEAAAEAVERVGLRALFAPLYLWDRRECFEAVPSLYSPSLMARAPIDLDRSLAQLDAELHRNSDPDALVRGYVFVYGVGTASPELLRAAHAYARSNDVPLQLHAGYVPGEAEIYRKMTGVSQLVHMRDLGVLDEHTVIIHANVLDDDEEAAVRETGCQVVWCPAAFFSLGLGGSASFKMAERYRQGTRVALGTDGAFACTPGGIMLAAHYAAQAYGDPRLARRAARNADDQRGRGRRNGGRAGKPGARQARRRSGAVRPSVRSPPREQPGPPLGADDGDRHRRHGPRRRTGRPPRRTLDPRRRARGLPRRHRLGHRPGKPPRHRSEPRVAYHLTYRLAVRLTSVPR